MRKGSWRSADPREIEARFESTCAESGRPIKRGERCIYYPSSRKVYGLESRQADEFRAWQFDCQVLGADY